MNNFSQMVGDAPKNIDIDKVISDELNGVVNYTLWLETIELQKKFNDSVAPDWLRDSSHEKYNFWMAILDETVEVLNSKHWKWWKNKEKMGEVDWNNIKVELIDLFHFILSISIQSKNENMIFSQMIAQELNNRDQIQDDKFFEDFWDEFLMAVHLKMLPVASVKLVDFWYRAGGSADELFKEYRIKAALNNIRQEFGYKEGKYEKEWLDIDSGKKVEDNVMAWKLAQAIPVDNNLMTNIEKSLRDYYLTHMAI
jgi:dimeric dUTPase (all-alpha-NTP-PPase superfamily)